MLQLVLDENKDNAKLDQHSIECLVPNIAEQFFGRAPYSKGEDTPLITFNYLSYQ